MNSMWRSLLRWMAPLLLACLAGLPAAHAQTTSAAESAFGRTSALPYAVALASMLLVLVIVCAPSRKG